MASEAKKAADALLMAYAGAIDGDDDAVMSSVRNCYGDLGEASTVLAGHLVLELRLLTALVNATHRRPDDLLREVARG